MGIMGWNGIGCDGLDGVRWNGMEIVSALSTSRKTNKMSTRPWLPQPEPGPEPEPATATATLSASAAAAATL